MKLIRYSKDVYQLVDDEGAVEYLAVRLANDKWGAFDRNDNRLTKEAFGSPRQVQIYIVGRRAALEKEKRE